ncbi:uncharacterized protein LOC131233128 [Magnolia sinica]|uniref:uncharacterized protein LOC131233128 n=1 Tax=Magnolia sinica TaxID=86752 RepID=UPI0026595A5A|nr:uncharacterized protein LOC131233128 [Magnolia sinica]
MLSDSSESAQKLEGRSAYNMSSGPVSTSLSASKDRISLEQNRAKGAAGKKKKRREFHLKANAAGTSSDLYMAYKGPEEKPETAITPEIVDSTSDVKQVSADATEKDLPATEDDAQSKAEIDDWDWEDVVEISSPKLKTLENGEQLDGAGKHDDEYGSGVSRKKKYSKDFLLTFSEQYTDLPLGLEIGSDIVDAIMSGPVANPHLVERESYPSSGRITDRPSGGSRPDHRGSSIVDDDKWSKAPGPFASGRDPRLDVGHGGAVINFRPGQCGNHGDLRNPPGQPSGQYGSGILSGPIQSLASPGGMARNSPDADRWQHAPGIHKGMEAGGLKKQRSIVSRPPMDVVLSSELRTKVTSKMRKTSEAEPALAAVITSTPVARPFPAVAMTFSTEVVPVMAPSEAVPIAPPTPAPEARAPEAPVGVEPITISKSSAEEQAPEVSPSGVRREVVGEIPGSVVPVRSVAHYPTANAELLVGRTDALVRYTTTLEAAAQASVVSGVGGTSEPTSETLPSGYHMALLNPWAAKHAPEAKIAATLSLRHINFMNDYAAVCYQSLPMMVEVKERLKEMERLEAERAKFVVEKAEQEARMAKLEAQRVKLKKLLEASAAEREELRRAAARGRVRELALQGEVNQLQARLDVANPEVRHLREAVRCLEISLEDAEGDASRLEKDLERVRHKATEGLAQQRTVLEAVAAANQERLRGELEARAASQVTVAVAAYKESAERAREMDKLYFFGYNTGFDTCLAEVKKFYPTIDLDALAADKAEDAEPVAADDPESAPPFVEAGPDTQPPSSVAGPSTRRE